MPPVAESYIFVCMTAILCRELRKRYPARPAPVEAVNGLDLEVRTGECFGLLGPNGAGKTTTIEILEGLLPATSGDVEILGERWGRDDEALRQRLGISLQETRLAEKLTVLETLILFRSFYARGVEPRTVLEQVDLVEKARAYVGKLSGGQKQRLAVAAPWSAIRSCSFSMSRPPGSIRNHGGNCGTSSAPFAPRAAPFF